MPTYLYKCRECEKECDKFFSLKDHRPDVVPCEHCGQKADYQFAAPMVLRKSFLDGQKRKGFQDLKEASKLNVAAAQEDNLGTKAELEKESRKLGYNLKKDTLI